MKIKFSNMIVILFSGMFFLGIGSLAHAADVMANGEVRKVDRSAKRITLTHGEIKNLAMQPMTMAYGVMDAAMLNQVKVGDKVKFSAEDLKGVITVTRIERQK